MNWYIYYIDSSSKNEKSSEERFRDLCSYLIKRYAEDESQKRTAKTREVLAVVGKGLLIAGLLFAPKYSRYLSANDANNPTWTEFNKYSKYYNLPLLKKTLKRLQNQKMIVVKETAEEQVVELTEKGRIKVLRYAIGEFDVKKQEKWDGKWRIIMYDVSDKKKSSRDILRNTLQKLGFLKLQESVYLFPFPCGDEIEFLRTYYRLNSDVTMLVTSRIEHDEAYRQYFGV